jgi:hypothetical protein
MIWDLSCLEVVYTETTKTRIGDFDNQVIGRGPKLRELQAFFRSFFWISTGSSIR